jgi:DNA-binding beta-propeller fold protein YncE
LSWNVIIEIVYTTTEDLQRTIILKRNTMLNQFVKSLIILIALFCSCQNAPSKIDFIIAEKDLIPEGLAVNNKTGMIYVGSTYKRKIIQIDMAGFVSDFIAQESDSIWSVLGIEVDENNGVLWANTAHIHEVMPLINHLDSKQWMTTISAFDIANKKLLKKYTLVDTTSAFNDLTIASNGNVYSTESANNKVFMVNKKTDSLELFLDLKEFNFPNGITYVQKTNSLFVSVREGILKIDIDSKKLQLLATNKQINAKRIDGLAHFKNYFIGHQSSKVSKFYINEDYTKILKSELIDSGDEFDASTTGEVAGDAYYYIVNSQLSSGINFQSKTTKPMDSLENVIIRKISLN